MNTAEQLQRVEQAGAREAIGAAALLGCGAIGAAAAQLLAASCRKLILVDKDVVSATTTILGPYSQTDIGASKALTLQDWICRKFCHMEAGRSAVGLCLDAAKLGRGFWSTLGSIAGAVVVVCLDHPASVAAAAQQAREAGIPCVAATIGGDSAQVLAFPPSAQLACYWCLGMAGDPARPCLGTASQDVRPTIAVPAAAYAAASLSVSAARQLLNRAITIPTDLRIMLGPNAFSFTVSQIERSSRCSMHTSTGKRGRRVFTCATSDECWNEITARLGWREATLIPPTLPVVHAGANDASVPIREFGYSLWPVLDCDVAGQQVELELRGDARLLGLEQVLEVQASDRS